MKNLLFTFILIGSFESIANAQLTVSFSGLNNSPSVCTRQIVANVSGGSGNYSYTWGTTNSCTPPDNTHQTLSITCTSDGVAYVFVTDNVTGNFTRSANISFLKVLSGNLSYFIPNVFTPNGDGVNDTWGVADANHGSGPLNAYSMTINVVNSQQRSSSAWNVSLNPTSTPGGIVGYNPSWNGAGWVNGSYFYTTVTLTNCSGSQTFNGDLTLIK